MVPVQRVTLPIRQVMCRYNRRTAEFLPCEFGDERGSLLIAVDTSGRPVTTVHGIDGAIGYQLNQGSSVDVPRMAAWIAAHTKITEDEGEGP